MTLVLGQTPGHSSEVSQDISAAFLGTDPSPKGSQALGENFSGVFLTGMVRAGEG